MELIDDPDYLQNELKKVHVDGYHLHVSQTKKNGIIGTYVDVHLEHHHDHHHEHGEGCGCGHHHDHEGHHHAEDVFTSWGIETPKKYSKEEISAALKVLSETMDCGMILRAKGIIPSTEGGWINFDLVPGEYEVRDGEPDYTGKLCVIGTNLDEAKIKSLFKLA